MRSKPIWTRSLLAVLCGALLLVLAGCPKQEDLPVALDVDVPPTPTNFVITASGTDYTFEWEISDATDVKNYRLYVIGVGFTPELLAEPTTPTVQQTLPYNVTGLQFGVSAVSNGNIEGDMALADAP